MMFVDASAIVAILLNESGSDALSRRLRACEHPLTSGIALYEAVLAVGRDKKNLEQAERAVWAFTAVTHMEVVAIDEQTTRTALEAFGRYGKGQGHPAQLNLGDCFAYACARTHHVPLLFVGDDFAQTDIRPALPRP